MRRRFLLGFALMAAISSFAQEEDPVIMTVAGNDIRRSEFEYFFNKNNPDSLTDRKTVAEFADLYVNFKLKVAAAVDAGMDTAQSFIDEYAQYRGIEAEKYLVSPTRLENMALTIFNNSKDQAGPKGLYYVGVITIMPKEPTQGYIAEAKVLVDSVHGLLKDGADFMEVASKYSQDGVAQRGGMLGWTGMSDMPPVVSDAVFSLEPGELSEPYLSEYGWQIFKIFSQRKFEKFEDHRQSIMDWMQESGLVEQAKLEQAKSISEEKGWGLEPEQALAREDSLLEDTYPEFALLSREYHDGLLMFDISNAEIWENSATDTAALEAWYAANPKKFKYEQPHFKGVVIFAKDEERFHQVEKLLEGVPEDEWVKKVVDFNKDSIQVRVLQGPFAKGENILCDHAVFGTGEYVPMKGFPYEGYIGSIVDTPDTWTDVSGQVIADYQESLEKAWVKRLRQQYPYKINRKVLKTVGRH
ncbi:MAG: peptidyl-prolyl cis-trans isomerase [Bacteroidaceae bacterium]|nr:peptidyl-prolyl cis-trans isomerase [Bacteroidaceae bacterium]